MKTTLIVLFVLVAATSFGQVAGAISSQAQKLDMPEHPMHASTHAMASEQPIVGGTGADTYAYAQGERPVWEFGPVAPQVPLGDIARAYRREKLTMKKAEFIFEKQGS